MKENMKIALVGSPNSGKTSLFNALTGMNQKVGNFPGVTVDRKLGSFHLNKRIFTLIDLPGCYSLYSVSDDERVTARVLTEEKNQDFPDLVLIVADHSNLNRSLVLATQVRDLGFPLIVALNMSDLVSAADSAQDPEELEAKLGFPFASVSALKGTGLDVLKRKIEKISSKDIPTKSFFRIPPSFLPFLEKLKEQKLARNDYAAWRLLLSDHPQVADMKKTAGIQDSEGLKANELAIRFSLIEEVRNENQNEDSPNDLTNRADKILLHPVWGFAIFLGILFLVFQAIFAWAQVPMDAIDMTFGKTGAWLKTHLPDSFFTGLLVDGLWSGLGGILVFVPQIAFLFMFISILEESGYMSRVVFLMDRVMRPFGFSGKSVIPLIGGMACAVPSIMMARSIPDKKERLITILVTPLMSCAARIPVYTLLIGMFVPSWLILGVFNIRGIVMLGMYMLGFLMTLAVAFVLKHLLKRSGDSIFVTELPLYRMPRWKNVGLTIYNKCKTFVFDTGKIILVISSLLWVLASNGPPEKRKNIREDFAIRKEAAAPAQHDSISLAESSALLQTSYAGMLGEFIEPAIRPLGFDWKIGICLVTSFAAREVFVGTMATLYSVGDGDENIAGLRSQMAAEINPKTGKNVYTPASGIALLLFYAFAMQCMSTVAVVKRETGGWKWALIMTAYMTVLAYVFAFAAFQIFSRIL